ncbi:hypothetical protein [Agromyces mariniharenae]|uniref:Uncharacterized protein n=1 Tax=Agromyces mariniharenae TaxID=2604423 RepID=A0A5S4UY95_9MICO|nr:hypothetical protein [Agromyces mariniharenae]TYL50563.1 hypothetical protein FYC51_15370 [Agromyces mariniharenae]
MTATDQPPSVEDAGAKRPEEAPEHRILRAAAQLAGTAILAGSIATLVGSVLAFAFPVLFLFVLPWPFLPLAAASGGIAGGAGLAVGRALGWRVTVERVVVPAAAGVASFPVLLAVSGITWGVPPWLWVAWIVAAVAAAMYGHRRTLRHPLDEWRPVLVRLLVGAGLTVGISAFFLLPSAQWLGGAVPTFLALGGVLLLSGILVSLGPFPSRTSAALAWAGFTLLVASVLAVMVGVTLQSRLAAIEVGPPPPPTVWAGDPADFDPTSDRPRDPSVIDVPPPTLDVGRAQFAALAAATLEAAGPEARWRDEPGVVVREVDCGDGRTALRIDAEFAMGEITDVTTDEQDRAVTEANLAAADRIVLAWSAAGLGTPEVLHGEPILGGAAMSAVDFAKVDFAFGVAQPRIEGRCLPNG